MARDKKTQELVRSLRDLETMRQASEREQWSNNIRQQVAVGRLGNSLGTAMGLNDNNAVDSNITSYQKFWYQWTECETTTDKTKKSLVNSNTIYINGEVRYVAANSAEEDRCTVQLLEGQKILVKPKELTGEQKNGLAGTSGSPRSTFASVETAWNAKTIATNYEEKEWGRDFYITNVDGTKGSLKEFDGEGGLTREQQAVVLASEQTREEMQKASEQGMDIDVALMVYDNTLSKIKSEATSDYNSTLSAYKSTQSSINKREEEKKELEAKKAAGVAGAISAGTGELLAGGMTMVTTAIAADGNRKMRTGNCYVGNPKSGGRPFAAEGQPKKVGWQN
jgi:hypothetical protein